MKKSFLFVAALVMTFAACQKEGEVQDKTVATFEEAAISPAKVNSEFKLDTTGTFQSGNFIFQQVAMPSTSFYSCNVVSNHTDTTFVDWNDAWKAIAGGAYAGKNYVVWNKNYYGDDAIKLATAAVVPGFYVTNSVYAYASITKGDWSGPAFGDDDWFLLTVTGSLEGKAVNTAVEFYLAKGKSVVTDWTYVDLSSLGKVDELYFELSGSRTDPVWGLNTPAYFAFDNLGGKK
ncbi:MAG: DUF4465 domain-containing protein [Paludibacteraceae bacterium]|nr:DUF4465 domain-containing protein [Paludibacteraceae bacterium]